jgi:uncharacterized protein YaiE (UPF0345 family)
MASIAIYTNDTTPDYTFRSSEAGTITSVGGSCALAGLPLAVSAGNNTVTFTALAEGTYSDCTITVTDGVGNISSPLSVSKFTIDTTGPVVNEVTLATNNPTPRYTFSSNEIGVISYPDACVSTDTSAAVGNNNIIFGALVDGNYTCSLVVTDRAGNPTTLNITPFWVDATAPVITAGVLINNPGSASLPPTYTFTSNEDGDILYSGGCSSVSNTVLSTDAPKTIVFDTIKTASYANCKIKVRDAAGNISSVLSISYSVDMTAPALRKITTIPTYVKSSALQYTFSTNETGSITSVGGSCSLAGLPLAVSAGNNTVTFDALAEGTYNDCTLIVTDAGGNASKALAVNKFTVDDTLPTLLEVTPVADPANDVTPRYTFNSSEIGTINYGGACMSTDFSAATGNNVINFVTLMDGTYNACTITVTDRAGNASLALPITAFTIDTVLPVVTEVTPVTPNPTNDTTPDYTFNATKAGNITYAGGCSSVTTAAVSGNNTITFKTLVSKTYNSCTIKVTDAAGNKSDLLNVSGFTIDTVAPVLRKVTAIATYTNDPTPDYTFSSTEAGTITSVGGSCSLAGLPIPIVAGNNTVTFNALGEGTYNDCTITVTDGVGNVSSALAVAKFTVDVTAPTVLEVTPIANPGNDSTPRYTFNSNEIGVIAYGGSCASTDFSAVAANNIVNFITLMDGTYTDCTVTVTDRAGNPSLPLDVSDFTIDTILPVLTEVTPVATPTSNNTPSYTFKSTDFGAITYSGGCSSATTTVVSIDPANTVITFNALGSNTYSNCKIRVRDSAGNLSLPLVITPFTVDTITPVIKVKVNVPTPSNDTTPSYTFSSTEAGSITYGGSCSSATGAAIKGNNTVTFNTLAVGTYTNCTITVTDAVGHVSTPLSVNSFTIVADAAAPILAQITPVVVSGIDTTPNYTFSSDEAGTITYGGDCSSTTMNALVGNNTITFNSFTPQAVGTHSNCTITVTDAAANPSIALNVSTFTIVQPKLLNDTGITLCGDYAFGASGNHHNDVSCIGADVDGDPIPVDQDALFGRDSNGATNTDSNGHKGFDFTKLDNNGDALAIQNGVYDELTGTEGAGTKWRCVRDNVTGLIWEVKTDDAGLRDKDNTYDWATTAPVYVANVNALGSPLCGATDWRLPTAEELMSIVNHNVTNPSIDALYFPNTISGEYWSSMADHAIGANAWTILFGAGEEVSNLNTNAYSVRLVRNAP